MKLNKKGFTLMEVLTVIIIITGVMMITIPLISSIMGKNQQDLYHSIETMMEEYAKANKIKNRSLLLSELDGLNQVPDECKEGYVEINPGPPKSYKAYIKCGEKYTTDGYENVNLESIKGIESCPECKFLYFDDDNETISMYTTWNTAGWDGGYPHVHLTPTVVTEGLHDDYRDVIKETGKNFFFGVVLNNNHEIARAYACGIKDDVPFCIEGTSDGSKHEENKELLQSEKLWNNACYSDDIEISCNGRGNFRALSFQEGTAWVGEELRCSVSNYGEMGCYVPQK